MSEQPMIVQGRQVDSVNEYNVAIALDRRKKEYIYQYPWRGGNMSRGGQVIDFLVLEPPQDIPVFVGAEGYWHTGSRAAEDDLKRAELNGSRQFALAVDITEEESRTIEAALQAIAEKVG